MDNPDLAEEFPSFTAPPWTSAASDPNILAQPPEQIIQANWEEWMQWDQKTSSDPVDFQRTPDLVSGGGDSSSQADTLSSKEHSQSPGAPLHPIPQNLGSNTFGFDPAFTTNAPFDMSVAAFPSPPEINDVAPSDTFFDSSIAWTQNARANQPPQLGLDLASVPQSHQPLPTPSTERSSLSPAKNTASGSDSSPEPMARSANAKKRKVSDDEDEDSGSTKQGPVKKTAHNMIEKRYRTNLNDKIAALRDSVPSLRVMSRPNGTLEDDDPEDLEGLTPAHKLNKATVLSKATEYIRHLEKRNKKLNEELLDYKNRLDSMNKMALSGPMIHGMMNMPDSTIRYQEDAFSTTSSHSHATKPIGPPQGLIPVPESMANLHRRHPNQPHYAHSHSQYASYAQPPYRQGVPNQQPMVNGRGGNGIVNKIMIGSFAGLMVLEGFSQRGQSSEEPERRGLFAVPIHLFGELLRPSLSALLGPSQHVDLLPFIKFILVAMAFATLAGPLFSYRPKSKKATMPAVRVIPGLSLASPIELRKQAWLTAVQSVWVPRHSLILEIAALALKILKLSTRKMIGWQGYAFITGTTKEQEDGRVKAWSIAWDAQLTGGDSEINVLRLILTLMASGTLPDTPARLMLKALHIRILLWEMANSGYGRWYKFEAISAKLSRKYWNHARAECKISNHQKDSTEHNRLPPHLATLIEVECDDVLVDPIIQRAYNLAWNKPSGENTNADVNLDTVVEDFAISSPLDALAAWWSNLMLNRALSSYLAEDDEWVKHLEDAVSVAPPNSGAHIRALVAKSILIDDDRDQTIAAAFNAVPSKLQDRTDVSRGSGLMNVMGNSPVPPDVIKTLTLARCLSLVTKSRVSGSQEARLRATYPIATINTTEYAFSLLSFVAAYRILGVFVNDSALLESSKGGLEHLASSLRLWVGHESGRKSGLSSETRGSVVEKCLHISKLLTGMNDSVDSDDGYVSGDESTISPVSTEAAD